MAGPPLAPAPVAMSSTPSPFTSPTATLTPPVNDESYAKKPATRPPGWTRNVQLVTRWICGHDDLRATKPLLPDYQVEAWETVVRELGRLP